MEWDRRIKCLVAWVSFSNFTTANEILVIMRNLITTLILILLFTSAKGDSIHVKAIRFHTSENGEYLFKIESPYLKRNFEDTVGFLNRNFGTLFRIINQDSVQLWRINLVNIEQPGSVYISNNGEYVITSGEVGVFQKNTLVIYGKNGKLIKNYDLHDVVPKGLIFKEFSVLTFTWRGRMYFKDNKFFEMEIVANGHENKVSEFEIIKVELSTGSIFENKKLIKIASRNRKVYDKTVWDYPLIEPPPLPPVIINKEQEIDLEDTLILE